MVGNVRSIDIHSTGFNNFESLFEPSKTMIIKNILHVPSIAKNLFKFHNVLKTIAILLNFTQEKLKYNRIKSYLSV